MLHGHYSDVKADDVDSYGSRKVKMRWLMGPMNGSPNFAMRVLTIEPGGFVGMHQHPNEHEVFILRGKCHIKTETEEVHLKDGDFILIPENCGDHSFINEGDDVLEFICCIPNPS